MKNKYSKKIIHLLKIKKIVIKDNEDLFTNDNLTVKRPGNGLSPMKWDELIETRSKRDFNVDELIKE